MSKEKTFRNKVNRVQGDLELMVAKALAEKSNATWKERYCGLILELNDYGSIKCESLKDCGIKLPPDTLAHSSKKVPKSYEEYPVGSVKQKPSTSQQLTKKQAVSDQHILYENTKLNEMNYRLQQRISEMESHIQYYKSENASLKQRVEEAEDNEKITNIEKKRLHEQKEKALHRLSQVAGSRLKDGNPSIADLSDSNRPTSLSMQLSELYSNEWTNAFELMADKGMEEKAIINCLLKCIATAFTECRRITEGDTKGGESKSEKLSRLRNQSPDQLKTVLKRCATTVLASDASLNKAGLQTDVDILKYVDECVNVCWWMCVQDPPLDLLWDLKHGYPWILMPSRSTPKVGSM